MLRAHELAKQLLALEGNPVVTVFDSLGYPTPVKLEELLHNDYVLFDKADTVVIATDRDAWHAALAEDKKAKA